MTVEIVSCSIGNDGPLHSFLVCFPEGSSYIHIFIYIYTTRLFSGSLYFLPPFGITWSRWGWWFMMIPLDCTWKARSKRSAIQSFFSWEAQSNGICIYYIRYLIYLYMYIWIYVCVIHIYIYIYICIYIYIYIFPKQCGHTEGFLTVRVKRGPCRSRWGLARPAFFL